MYSRCQVVTLWTMQISGFDSTQICVCVCVFRSYRSSSGQSYERLLESSRPHGPHHTGRWRHHGTATYMTSLNLLCVRVYVCASLKYYTKPLCPQPVYSISVSEAVSLELRPDFSLFPLPWVLFVHCLGFLRALKINSSVYWWTQTNIHFLTALFHRKLWAENKYSLRVIYWRV